MEKEHVFLGVTTSNYRVAHGALDPVFEYSATGNAEYQTAG
jgi:hypothetical protein